MATTNNLIECLGHLARVLERALSGADHKVHRSCTAMGDKLLIARLGIKEEAIELFGEVIQIEDIARITRELLGEIEGQLEAGNAPEIFGPLSERVEALVATALAMPGHMEQIGEDIEALQGAVLAGARIKARPAATGLPLAPGVRVEETPQGSQP